MNHQEMADRAAAATEPPLSGISTANYIALFTMFVLQDLLMQQLVNPVTNFNNIIGIAGSIAALNGSIKPVEQ